MEGATPDTLITLVTASAVAKELGISITAVNTLARNGYIRTYFVGTPNGRRTARFSIEEVTQKRKILLEIYEKNSRRVQAFGENARGKKIILSDDDKKALESCRDTLTHTQEWIEKATQHIVYTNTQLALITRNVTAIGMMVRSLCSAWGIETEEKHEV